MTIPRKTLAEVAFATANPMTAKPKKQKPTKQKFVVEVAIETAEGWTKTRVRQVLTTILAHESGEGTEWPWVRVRKVDLD